MKYINKKNIIKIVPLLLIIVVWEVLSAANQELAAYISTPKEIVIRFFELLFSGNLIVHFCVTAFEALSGLILGLLVGCLLGFFMVYNDKIADVFYPYIFALSAIPTYALAPIMVYWFGAGIGMKILLAFLATVFTTAFHTLEGSKKVSVSDEVFFNINKASKKQHFWLLSFPASIDWIIQSLKINSSLCLLGAFLGEYIASEFGLGHMIRYSIQLYKSTDVFVAIVCFILLSMIFSVFASIANKNKIKIIRFATSFYKKRNRK